MSEQAQAYLASLKAQISCLEAATCRDVVDLNARHERRVRDRWLRFNEEVEPLRREIEAITKKLADVSALTPPAPIILE